MFNQIDPSRIFEIGGVVSRLLTAPKASVPANNVQVIAGVAGKRIRVMGWMNQSGGAQGSVLFKSASAGTALTAVLALPPSTALPWVLPIVECGYMETNTGEGLFMDVTVADVNVHIFYIIYTP